MVLYGDWIGECHTSIIACQGDKIKLVDPKYAHYRGDKRMRLCACKGGRKACDLFSEEMCRFPGF